tara:strand:+ start:115 stop:471 length:357 start_codon:yes stop_codon:yes gene_type:complete
VEHQFLFQHKVIQLQLAVVAVEDQEEMQKVQVEVLQDQIQFFQQLRQQVAVEVEHTHKVLVVMVVFLEDQVDQEETEGLVVQVIHLRLAQLKELMVQVVVILVVEQLLQDLETELLQV